MELTRPQLADLRNNYVRERGQYSGDADALAVMDRKIAAIDQALAGASQ